MDLPPSRASQRPEAGRADRALVRHGVRRLEPRLEPGLESRVGAKNSSIPRGALPGQGLDKAWTFLDGSARRDGQEYALMGQQEEHCAAARQLDQEGSVARDQSYTSLRKK